MNIDEDILAYATVAESWRRHLWEHHDCRDAPPNLGFVLNGDEAHQPVPVSAWQAALDIVGDDVQAQLQAILKYIQTWDEYTGFREIALVMEGYGLDMALDESDRPESLMQDFMTNPDTKVREELIITIARDDLVGGCELASAHIPMRITDGGVMEFDEPQFHYSEAYADGQAGGGVVEILKEAINARP